MKKIKTTRDIPEGSIIRIYKKGYGYGRIRIIENHQYYIAALSDSDLYDNLTELDSADAYYWVHNKGAYEFRTILCGRTVTDPRILFFAHSDEISYNAERKCIKARVNLPFKFFTFDPKNNQKSFSTEEIIYHNGAVIELSDREAVIISDEPFNDAIYIFGHIAIGGNTIEMIGRKEPIPGGEPNRFLITFNGMLEKERERILDYVYTVYRESSYPRP